MINSLLILNSEKKGLGIKKGKEEKLLILGSFYSLSLLLSSGKEQGLEFL